MLPFTKNVYVAICPACIKSEPISNLKSFLDRNAIIPVLNSRYKNFPPAVVDLVRQKDHVSFQEYDIFRWFSVMSLTHRGLCSHCVDVRQKAIVEALKESAGSKLKSGARQAFYNLRPYIYPDYQMLDQLELACRKASSRKINELVRLSYGVHQIRTAQAFFAPITFSNSILSKIPGEISGPNDETADVKSEAVRALGLTIPDGESLDASIEVLMDYQPQVSKIVSGLLSDSGGSEDSISIELLTRNIQAINTEIDRVQNLRRFIAFEAAIDFFKSNRALVVGGLAAAATGAVGGLIGCAASIVGATAASVAKKKGLIREAPAARRLGKVLARDTQPYLDKLISLYTGGELPAVNVLSIRRKLSKD
ncbi:hypothetical protein [Bradyrhizobium sp. BR 1433]|uniref:hypothetical protein n=1 Tax=Bradyrhizobium sp. BR 1433 TaxID=3447967 RepID=UPI003EE7319C